LCSNAHRRGRHPHPTHHSKQVAALTLVAPVLQVVVPPRFCDDRVQVLQADARLLTPAILEQYTKDVSTGFRLVMLWGLFLGGGLGALLQAEAPSSQRHRHPLICDMCVGL
jgi:hypothetical protein